MKEEEQSGKLSLVPTPIGNLEDMTFRAVRTLQEADLILAEDTRNSGTLLKHFEIDTPMKAFHAHNEHKVLEGLVAELKAGKHFAQISDAGTPGLSDPGFLLARAASVAGILVEALPGASALLPALTASGLPCDKFVFEGFLPHKKGRKTRLETLATEERTIVFYESPHRILKTLSQLAEHFGENRQACLSREISKKFEEHVRGSLTEIHEHFAQGKIKGEIVLTVAGR